MGYQVLTLLVIGLRNLRIDLSDYEHAEGAL